MAAVPAIPDLPAGGGAATDLQGGTLTMAILDALSQTPMVKAGKGISEMLLGSEDL